MANWAAAWAQGGERLSGEISRLAARPLAPGWLGGAPVAWDRHVLLVEVCRGAAAVQQESTATGADVGGRAGTREDGDLRRYTLVDVLPGDGMQEARGSSPLSSTRS